MSDIPWHNETTREAYVDFVENVADPMDFARGWLEMHAGDFSEALQLLGRRLKMDAQERYARAYSDPLQGHLIMAGLRKVYWWQVAGRILKRVQPAIAEPPQASGESGSDIV